MFNVALPMPLPQFAAQMHAASSMGLRIFRSFFPKKKRVCTCGSQSVIFNVSHPAKCLIYSVAFTCLLHPMHRRTRRSQHKMMRLAAKKTSMGCRYLWFGASTKPTMGWAGNTNNNKKLTKRYSMAAVALHDTTQRRMR